MDHDKPRQKNSPLDYFYPRFGWLQTSSKLGSFLFESIINIRKSIAFAMLFWWAGMDSNHRTRMRTDLQSAAFSHSATYPYLVIKKFCVGAPSRIRTLDPPVMSRLLWPTELREHLFNAKFIIRYFSRSVNTKFQFF